ncbi:hypothetical protein [Saccharomonospora halophila]|uniref:hypothetical protein n=1 Tax=Saccharomonospora halophila TaxID=129922 RepID=UPI001E3F8843|nr:hypothetical protein [Saccharomonospora halophila]
MSVSDLQDHVRDVMENPLRTKELNNSRKAYLGRDNETVVLHDPMSDDGGTVFRRTRDLDSYWEGLR